MTFLDDQPAAPRPPDPDRDPDDDLFDPGDAGIGRPRRTDGWTATLLAALLAVAGFGGGVTVQKNHDAGLASAAGGGAPAFRSGGAGPAGAGAAGGAGAAADVPVVVGTVTAVASARITVTDLAGTAVPVRITATTTVTTTGTTSLAAGSQLSVAGTKATDGTVTATAVTARTRSAG